MKRQKKKQLKKRQRFDPAGFTPWEWKIQIRKRQEFTKKKRKLYLKQKNEKTNEQWGEEIRAPTIE